MSIIDSIKCFFMPTPPECSGVPIAPRPTGKICYDVTYTSPEHTITIPNAPGPGYYPHVIEERSFTERYCVSIYNNDVNTALKKGLKIDDVPGFTPSIGKPYYPPDPLTSLWNFLLLR